jgi:type 1 glutamine amidotransferase
MNVITPKRPQDKISAEEKQRRKAAVDYARGSARLEGFVSSPFAEQMYERFINGEITAKELSAKISAHYTL